jgi:tryptophan-rich sensory protein
VNPLLIFIIRAVLGILFSILVMRLFHPGSGMITIMIVAVILVGLAYIFESFRKRKNGPGEKEQP